MHKQLTKFIPPCTTRSEKILRILFAVAGLICLAYYMAIGFGAGLITTSILFIWLIGAAFCAAIAIFIPRIVDFVKRSKKWVIALIALFPAIGILLFTAGEVAIISGFTSDLPDAPADYLVILGAKVNPSGPSLLLQSRIDAAYDYLVANPQTVAIASGGQGSDEPMSEARCIANELIRRGIDADRILLEELSTDTSENIKFCRELIEDSSQASVSVVIVSNEFHCFRATAIARRYWDANVGHLSADSVLGLLPHYMVREFIGLCVDWLQGNISFA